jgi:hypothetical protein
MPTATRWERSARRNSSAHSSCDSQASSIPVVSPSPRRLEDPAKSTGCPKSTRRHASRFGSTTPRCERTREHANPLHPPLIPRSRVRSLPGPSDFPARHGFLSSCVVCSGTARKRGRKVGFSSSRAALHLAGLCLLPFQTTNARKNARKEFVSTRGFSLLLATISIRAVCSPFQLGASRCALSGRTFNPKVAGSIPANGT